LSIQVGRIDINAPKINGHKGPVTDVAWDPFNDNRIVSASEDCTIMLWNIPDEGLTKDYAKGDELFSLEKHQRRVGEAACS
jgi:WD40 repeat protein